MDASKAYVNAVFGGNESVSLLEMTRIQAQVLVPVLRALRAEIGVERANAIVITALREWSRDLFRKVGEQIEGSPRQRWEALNAASLPKIGGDIEFQPLTQTTEELDVNVTGCRYADFFRQLGEPELGAVLLCEADLHLVNEVGSPDVTLTRTQTIMTGAPYCDFRWRMVNRTGS